MRHDQAVVETDQWMVHRDRLRIGHVETGRPDDPVTERVGERPLVDALRDGVIAAAALDVTDPEPMPASHPLVSLPNCLIVPHIASASRATRGKMAAMAAANLIAGVRGEPLPTPVTPPG